MSSFNGACAEAGSDSAATNEADSKTVSRIDAFPVCRRRFLFGIFYAPKGTFAGAM